MKRQKKWLSILLAISMVLPINGIQAVAAEETDTQIVVESEVEQSNEVETMESEVSEVDSPSEEVIASEESKETQSTEEYVNADETKGEEANVDETEESEESIEETLEEGKTKETAIEETEEDVFLFTGLSADYMFTSREMERKEELAEYVNNTKDLDVLFSKMDYEEGIITCFADTEEKAIEYAAAFDGTLRYYRMGIASIILPDEETVEDAFLAAADLDSSLPAVWPSNYMKICLDIDSEEEQDTDLIQTQASNNAITQEIINDLNQKITNDPFMDSAHRHFQWYHKTLGDYYAWNVGYKGQGVKVAVIDSGLQTDHEDLKGNIVGNYNYTNGANGTNEQTPVNDHGSHCAGIIAAVGNNEKGGIGIAPEAKLYGFRVFTKDSDGDVIATSEALAVAIEAATRSGCDIVNMSMGTVTYNGTLAEEVKKASEAGVILFSAAGNESTNAVSYPADYDGVYKVAGVNTFGVLMSISNYGNKVDFAFPGRNMPSVNRSGYRSADGTSSACSVASGVAALLLSTDKFKGMERTVARRDALIKCMKSNAIKSGSKEINAGYTYIPNIVKSVDQLYKPSTPVIDQKSGKYTSATISVKMTADMSAGNMILYTLNGKNPVYENKILNAGTFEAKDGETIEIGNAKKVVLKVMVYNTISRKKSKIITRNYTFMAPPTSIEIKSVQNITNLIPGKSLTLKSTIQPSYAVYSPVEWKISPENQGVTVKQGKVVASKKAKAGVYKVYASVKGKDRNSEPIQSNSYQIQILEKQVVTKVSLDAKAKDIVINANMYNGNTYDLSKHVVVEGGTKENLVYFSKNEKLATIDQKGIITGLYNGKVEVGVMVNDGTNRKASVKIQIVRPASSLIVEQKKPQKYMQPGTKTTFYVETYPANSTHNKVKWKLSSNDIENVEKYATIKNGVLTTKPNTPNGFIRITLECENFGGLLVSNGIWVDKREEKLKFNYIQKETTVPLIPGNYNAYVTPFGSVNTYHDGVFTSSNPKVAHVDSKKGTVTPVSPGKAIITFAVNDGTNEKCSYVINVILPASGLRVDIASNGIYQHVFRNEKSDDLYSEVCSGIKIQMKAILYSDFGTPTKSKVTWMLSETRDEKYPPTDAASIDQNGLLTIKKVDHMINIQIKAKCDDGTFVTSNTYYITIGSPTTYVKAEPFIQKYRDGGPDGIFLVVRSDGNGGNIEKCQISLGNSKNAIITTGNQGAYDKDVGALLTLFYPYSTEFNKRQKDTIEIKMMDGSNKTTRHTIEYTTHSRNSWTLHKFDGKVLELTQEEYHK